MKLSANFVRNSKRRSDKKWSLWRVLAAQRQNNGNRKFTIFAIQLLPRIKTVADPSSLTPKALFLSDVSYAYAIPNPKADPTNTVPRLTQPTLFFGLILTPMHMFGVWWKWQPKRGAIFLVDRLVEVSFSISRLPAPRASSERSAICPTVSGVQRFPVCIEKKRALRPKPPAYEARRHPPLLRCP